MSAHPPAGERFAIVLSTYNGAAFLDAQLESIRAQGAAGWRLYARDDASQDDSAKRLAAFAQRDPRIEVLPADGRNMGPAASFGLLLQHALDRGERHVFLSDQDDVWMPDKCERLLALIRAREAERGTELPVLAHSDLAVVDEELRRLHPSFVALQRIDGRQPPAGLLVGNSVTGCASVVNAALLRCALPMPEVAMHDWWLAQCAGAFGEIAFLEEPTLLYRQHGANAVGARGLAARAEGIVRSPSTWWASSARRFLRGLHQVWVLRARSPERGLAMVPEVRVAVEKLWTGLAAADASLRTRVSAAVRSGALPRAWLMKGLFLARVAMLPRLRARYGDERDGAAR
jgi:glycosyltransferase involved in cell wall biosynthesis